MKRLQIGVLGSAGNEEYKFEKPDSKMFAAAEEIGQSLAEQGCIVVNGGKGGVMEAVSKGAKRAGGVTIAEISGNGRGESNPFIDIEIVTMDIGFRGPSALVGMCDAVLVLGGGAGTLQEIAVAYRMAKPIILLNGYGGWTDRIKGRFLDERRTTPFVRTKSSKDAVKCVINAGQNELQNTLNLANNR